MLNFKKPFKKKTHHLSNQSIVSILDRKTLYGYDQILRKTTPENKERLTREVTKATTVQSDKLCNGEQIRVNIFFTCVHKDILFFDVFYNWSNSYLSLGKYFLHGHS